MLAMSVVYGIVIDLLRYTIISWRLLGTLSAKQLTSCATEATFKRHVEWKYNIELVFSVYFACYLKYKFV